MLINDECSNLYNRVGDFCCCFGIEERKSYTAMDRYTRSVRPTPLKSARSMALSAMVVECERSIYFDPNYFGNGRQNSCHKAMYTCISGENDDTITTKMATSL